MQSPDNGAGQKEGTRFKKYLLCIIRARTHFTKLFIYRFHGLIIYFLLDDLCFGHFVLCDPFENNLPFLFFKMLIEELALPQELFVRSTLPATATTVT